MEHNEVTGIICSKIICILLNERHVKKAKAANLKGQTESLGGKRKRQSESRKDKQKGMILDDTLVRTLRKFHVLEQFRVELSLSKNEKEGHLKKMLA
jgi:hypothetical protein